MRDFIVSITLRIVGSPDIDVRTVHNCESHEEKRERREPKGLVQLGECDA